MLSREIIIKNEAGIESRLAAALIQKTSNYKSNIWIEKDERKANAKSLLGVLSLGIANDSKVIITIEGEDEKIAMVDLEKFLKDGLKDSV